MASRCGRRSSSTSRGRCRGRELEAEGHSGVKAVGHSGVTTAPQCPIALTRYEGREPDGAADAMPNGDRGPRVPGERAPPARDGLRYGELGIPIRRRISSHRGSARTGSNRRSTAHIAKSDSRSSTALLNETNASSIRPSSISAKPMRRDWTISVVLRCNRWSRVSFVRNRMGAAWWPSPRRSLLRGEDWNRGTVDVRRCTIPRVMRAGHSRFGRLVHTSRSR